MTSRPSSSRPPREAAPAAGETNSTGQAGPPAPEGDRPPARPHTTLPSAERGPARELNLLRDENTRLRDALNWMRNTTDSAVALLREHQPYADVIEHLAHRAAIALEPAPDEGQSESATSTTRFSEVSDDAACFMLWRELFDPCVIARFMIDGEPVSKSRARFTKKGSKLQAYTPEKTHTAEQIVAWKFKAAAPHHKPDSECTYGVMALFFNGTQQRRDVDNMLKLILDGLNKVAWADDDQVIEVSGRKSFEEAGQELARTEVVVYRIGSVHRREKTCEFCGKRFATYQSWKAQGRRFCSQDCNYAWRRERRERTCAQCGEAYLAGKPNVTQKFCSRECVDASKRAIVACTNCGTEFTKQRCHVRAQNYCSAECRDARRMKSKASLGTCEACGGPTSKKSYRRCRPCHLDGAPTKGKPRSTT